MSFAGARHLALLGWLAICPAVAAAHGGDAEIVRVAALDADGSPWLLQVSGGLAVRHEDAWRFICPAELEASTINHALSADGQTAWAVTARHVWRITRDRQVQRAGAPCGDSPIELVAHRGDVYMLARDSARALHVLCELEAPDHREIYASDVAIDGAASDGDELWLVRRVETGLELEPASGGERRAYPVAGTHRAIRVAFAGDSLYARLIDSDRAALVRLHPDRSETLLETESALYGPVESAGVVYAGAGGGLVRIEDNPLLPIESSVFVEQLDGFEGRGFALAHGALYALPIAAPLFSLDDVRPPPAAESGACAMEWLRFQRAVHGPDHRAADVGAPDAATSGSAIDAGSEAPARSQVGCHTVRPPAQSPSMGRARAAWSLALAAGLARFFATRRRSRRPL